MLINDFLLTQLIDVDINEIWEIKNPMGLLIDECKRELKSSSKPESRLIWSNGMNNPTGVFVVGIYLDKKRLIGKGGGETLEIAEEMAARDALKRIYNTGESVGPLPFGDKARKHAGAINSIIMSEINSKNRERKSIRN